MREALMSTQDVAHYRYLPSVVEGVRHFGGRQGLGETLFEMYRFDTVLSYIYYYNIFFQLSSIFVRPYS
ncbi:MAG: hypothetical protein LUF26_01280, partial [Firmicutes bacterium]|nr:hypothetical protein [Bacillota bacterium]